MLYICIGGQRAARCGSTHGALGGKNGNKRGVRLDRTARRDAPLQGPVSHIEDRTALYSGYNEVLTIIATIA